MLGFFLMIEHLISPVKVEGAAWILALVRLHVVMPSLMVVPVTARGKILAANVTLKKLFTPVHPHMLDKISSLVEFPVAGYTC